MQKRNDDLGIVDRGAIHSSDRCQNYYIDYMYRSWCVYCMCITGNLLRVILYIRLGYYNINIGRLGFSMPRCNIEVERRQRHRFMICVAGKIIWRISIG
jgi:hypothetical protein